MKESAEQKFRDFLKNGNNRITSERFEVLNAALDYQGHFSADELFISMKNIKSEVSRATVYNTLELLAQCNLLTRRQFGDNMNRYESNVGRHNHDHLVCTNCGRIYEFSVPPINNIIEEITEKLGFEVTGYSFNIFGTCKDKKECCDRKNNR